jgi:hypothetical protein
MSEDVRDLVERLRSTAEDDLRAIARDASTMKLMTEPAELNRWAHLVEEAADTLSRLLEENLAATGYALRLAQAIHAKHYAGNPTWEPLPDLLGLLTQIDNMSAGMTRKSSAPPE